MSAIATDLNNILVCGVFAVIAAVRRFAGCFTAAHIVFTFSIVSHFDTSVPHFRGRTNNAILCRSVLKQRLISYVTSPLAVRLRSRSQGFLTGVVRVGVALG